MDDCILASRKSTKKRKPNWQVIIYEGDLDESLGVKMECLDKVASIYPNHFRYNKLYFPRVSIIRQSQRIFHRWFKRDESVSSGRSVLQRVWR